MAILTLLMVLLGGIIAYGGDWLGRRLGKQRLSLLGLRPRYTATLITTLTGCLTVALTITTMTLVNEAFREWITRGDQILMELRRNERELSQRAKELKALQGEVQQMTDELQQLRSQNDALKQQEQDLRGQLQARQAQLAQAEARLQQVENRLQREMERVRQLRAQSQQLRQRVATLRQERSALQQEIRQLEQTQQVLNDQNSILSRQSIELTRENAQLEKQNQQLHEQNSQLEERNRQLTERNRELTEQNSRLLDIAAERRSRLEQLQREVSDLLKLVNIRVMPIAVHAGEELTRVAFRAGLSEVRVRQMLVDMMKQAAEKARERGAAPDSDGRTVFIPEKVVRLASGEQVTVSEAASLETILTNIRASSEPVVAIVSAVTNTAKGEPVPVEVQLFRNPVIFRAGQEIARTVLDCREGKDPFAQMVAFLQGAIRQTAIDAGLIPRMEALGAQPTVGEMDAAVLLAIAEQARRCPGDRAVLIARARQDIRASDALQLEFEVLPLSASAGHGG